MTDDICSFETETLRAARSGDWPEALKDHVAGCEACRQTQSVAAFMGRVATAMASERPLPDPTKIWLASKLASRGASDRRLRNLQRIRLGLIGLAGGVAGWAALQWIPAFVADNADTLAIGGVSVALSAAIVYLAALRPLRNARQN